MAHRRNWNQPTPSTSTASSTVNFRSASHEERLLSHGNRVLMSTLPSSKNRSCVSTIQLSSAP
ncbi:hypothetical protein DPMN_042964 [Dreissena polymorpha]|uniref:Uncharacterized protein n=1 Tax=Dreissena polymorpha TaxID=45954 RepID=A0A9D4D1W6_DREPO|nr:hypothetical protein DPMN_042964 [Dreissena polymorpha]